MFKKLILSLGVMVFIVSSSASADLLAHLEFEGNIDDSSSNNITFTGNPGPYATGPSGFGQAMAFDKAYGNVVHAESISSKLSSLDKTMTIAFWAYGSENLPFPQEDPTTVFSANDPGIWSRISIQIPHSIENEYVFWEAVTTKRSSL